MPEKKLSILVFGQSFLGKIGGVQQSYAWLYEYLCHSGHTITHVTHLPVGEQGIYYKFPSSVNIRSINFMFNTDIRKKVCDLAQEIDPDVILVVNSGYLGGLISMALRHTPYPVILSERGNPEYCIKFLYRSRRFYELSTYCADFKHFLMPSYPLILPLELRNRARVISSLTMPTKVYAHPETPSQNSNKYHILYTGRFSPEKRLPLLLEAFSLISPRFPDWELILVGDGPDRPELEATISKYKLEELVHLLGYVDSPDKVKQYYIDSHIFVLPSSAEGCPLALREAMAHGLPVIGFHSCPGTNEIILHEKNGFLVKEDTAAALSISLQKLMEDSFLRLKLGTHGRDDVKQYAPEKIHSMWELMLYEAASFKGHKKKLWLQRFYRHPFRNIFNHIQILSIEKGNYKRDIFAYSPKHWFNELRGLFFKFSVINMVPLYYTQKYKEKINNLEYKSGIKYAINFRSKLKNLLYMCTSIYALSIKFGIDISKLYCILKVKKGGLK